MAYGFDQAGIRMPGGSYNLISAEEFMKMHQVERIKLILDGKVQFVRNGVVISPTEALRRQSSGTEPQKP